MIGSIHGRLLLAATLVLAAFLGLGAAALDQAFRDSLEQATQERLMSQVYGLLAAVMEDQQGRIQLPEILPDPRYDRPDSGLYAQVVNQTIDYQWRSASLLGRTFVFPEVTQTGVPQFQITEQGSDHFYQLSYRILWADNSDTELAYLFSVAEDAAAVASQVAAFRRTLFFWLGGASVLLLLGQGLVLRWGLWPLREVASDLEQIESGNTAQLNGNYPKELVGLTMRINSLIHSGRASQERYRNSLGDLAHSLKTPLAVLQGASEQGEESLKTVVSEQVPRMNEIVQYQLKRAAASGFTGVQQAVDVMPIVKKLLATLDKVYLEKGMTVKVSGTESAKFRGDQGDLLEVLGNLLENAYKYGHRQVAVSIMQRADALDSCIEDDGPGIAPEQRKQVLRRGGRVDQHQVGQGIGLSVANEIVQLYRGELSFGDSSLGGVLLKIKIPIY